MSQHVSRYKETLEVNYAVTGGSAVLPTTRSAQQGSGINVFEVKCTGLTAADGKLQLTDSVDGVTYTDSKDASGNDIFVTLSAAVTKLRVSGFVSGYIKFRYIEVTPQTGTIDTINCLYV